MTRIIRVSCAPDSPPALRKALAHSLDELLDQAAEVYRTHKRSTVGRVTLAGNELVVKRFNAPGLYARARRMVSISPARRAWRNASLLLQLGIPTPRNLACIQTVAHGLQPVSYLVTEHVEGTSSERFFADPDIPDDIKRRVAERILDAVTRLHDHGYIHGDLKGRNIIVRGELPYFIDLDTIQRRHLAFNQRSGVRKDFARLFRTVPGIREATDSHSAITAG